MSEENEVIEEPEIKTTESESGGEPAEFTATEQKASEMGWTPKDKFKGDPSKWRPADEYLKRGEEMLPIVKAQVKRQAEEIRELKNIMKQFGEYHSQTEMRAYENAYNTLREQRAEAIAKGDGVTFDKVDGEIEQLREQIKNQQHVKVDVDAESDPVYVEWRDKNSWVDDAKLYKRAVEIGEYLKDTGCKETGRDFLDKVGKLIKFEFPEKFTNPRRDTASSVEGGIPAQRRGGKSYADLPTEAKNICERMAKNVFPDNKEAQTKFKAEYVSNYDWS